MWQCLVRRSDVRSDWRLFPAAKLARPNGIVAFPMTDAASAAAAAVAFAVVAAAQLVLSDAHPRSLLNLAHYVSVSSIDPRRLDICHFKKIEKKMKASLQNIFSSKQLNNCIAIRKRDRYNLQKLSLSRTKAIDFIWISCKFIF